MIENWTQYNEGKYLRLTEGEKEFLWMKMESKKKKKNKELESDIYQQLKGDKELTSDVDFIKILNSLEYSMKKRIKDLEKKAPNGKYKTDFESLRKKLPSSWVGVSYSNLISKKKRDIRKGD